MIYLSTILPLMKKPALREIGVADPSARISELSPEFYLIDSNDSSFQDTLKKSIFVRHIFPVERVLELRGGKTEDLEAILSVFADQQKYGGIRFNVQCRKIGKELPYGCKDVEVYVGTEIEKRGGIPVYKGEEIMRDDSLFIFSIFLQDHKAYVGRSKAVDNLDPYADPARFYSRNGRSICRSEFKLIEALDRFKIPLEKGARALDLGAAPGGWSNVLHSRGIEVTAVDPADLDPRLKHITHFKGRAEDFKTNERYDLLVNDMNLDPTDSARVVLSQYDNLKERAYVIMTIKFVRRNYERLIQDAAEVLKERFEILAVKNLFHNHEEVTMLLRKRHLKNTKLSKVSQQLHKVLT